MTVSAFQSATPTNTRSFLEVFPWRRGFIQSTVWCILAMVIWHASGRAFSYLMRALLSALRTFPQVDAWLQSHEAARKLGLEMFGYIGSTLLAIGLLRLLGARVELKALIDADFGRSSVPRLTLALTPLVGVIAYFAGALLIRPLIVQGAPDPAEAFGESLGKGLVQHIWVAHVVVVAPICEEFMMRGYVFNIFKAGLLNSPEAPRYLQRGDLVANIFSSATFAAMHLNPLAFPNYFLAGLVFCEAYRRSKTVVGGTAVHAVMNYMMAVVMGAA
jgi:membrane protease YdiL (CAAX protease family)